MLCRIQDPFWQQPVPSASRAGLDLDIILPRWLFVLHQYLDEREARVIDERDQQHYQELRSSYDLSLLALALAQHYGLPSVGLDVTTDIDVALFFALHEFHNSAQDRWTQVCRRKSPDSELGVFYVLCPRRRFRLGYDEFQPPQLGLSGRNGKRLFFYIRVGVTEKMLAVRTCSLPST